MNSYKRLNYILEGFEAVIASANSVVKDESLGPPLQV